jgi:hypothetical protein
MPPSGSGPIDRLLVGVVTFCRWPRWPGVSITGKFLEDLGYDVGLRRQFDQYEPGSRERSGQVGFDVLLSGLRGYPRVPRCAYTVQTLICERRSGQS